MKDTSLDTHYSNTTKTAPQFVTLLTRFYACATLAIVELEMNAVLYFIFSSEYVVTATNLLCLV
jgi:hypothetical protein